uniref:FYVE-type domain-containing protein n=1 Tax=Phytophthora ramorum TaxID=164328 RepID=H3GZQ7_PHYRM
MVKDRFTENPFGALALTAPDAHNLLDIVNTIVDTSLERYENFWTVEKAKVNTHKWKLIKARDETHVFVEHQQKRASSRSKSVDSITELPSLLTVGTTPGNLDDVMLGVVNPTLESTRVKASYVDDLSAAAVLSNVVMPSKEDPFRSVVVKWMELNIPFQSTGLVQNRDFVYVEATGMTETFDGERIGFHVLHSVNFPQTPSLPNRVRANMSICGFFRQVRPNLVSVYVTGIMDPVGNDRVRRLVVSNMASAFLSTLKYAHCGQMKKLAWALDAAYTKSKVVGAPNPERICVTCRKAVSRRVGDFSKSGDACTLCFGLVCSTCRLQRKISFVGPDLRLSQRKVVFCAVCMHATVKENACEAARRQIRSDDPVNEKHF